MGSNPHPYRIMAYIWTTWARTVPELAEKTKVPGLHPAGRRGQELQNDVVYNLSYSIT